jgi:hypothetical protein
MYYSWMIVIPVEVTVAMSRILSASGRVRLDDGTTVMVNDSAVTLPIV